MAERERRHDREQPRSAAAEQQQADQEQDVIGADRDVLDAGHDEFPDHRQRSLPRPHVVRDAGLPDVEDRLARELPPFVHVQERLVRRIGPGTSSSSDR